MPTQDVSLIDNLVNNDNNIYIWKHIFDFMDPNGRMIMWPIRLTPEYQIKLKNKHIRNKYRSNIYNIRALRWGGGHIKFQGLS